MSSATCRSATAARIETKIDFQGLLNALRAAESRHGNDQLQMRNWRCGTAACIIGSFCLDHPGDRMFLDQDFHHQPPVMHVGNWKHTGEGAISKRFGITPREARWLFTSNPLAEIRGNVNVPDACLISGEEALARLRKFIYYKLKKQEMVVEEGRNGRVVDLGRNVSGNKAAVLAGAMA